MNFTKVRVTLLTSVIMAGMTAPLSQVSANDSISTEKVSNETVKSSENVDGNNATTVGNTVYSIAPEISNQFSVSLRAAKYKQGVSKVTKSGKYTTIYISKTDAQDIISGAGIVIGGYTGKGLGVLLGLAGLGTTRAIKGGIWIKTMNITGTDGMTHTVVQSFGWQ